MDCDGFYRNPFYVPLLSEMVLDISTLIPGRPSMYFFDRNGIAATYCGFHFQFGFVCHYLTGNRVRLWIGLPMGVFRIHIDNGFIFLGCRKPSPSSNRRKRIATWRSEWTSVRKYWKKTCFTWTISCYKKSYLGRGLPADRQIYRRENLLLLRSFLQAGQRAAFLRLLKRNINDNNLYIVYRLLWKEQTL